MPWPSPYYWAAAHSAGATLFGSMAPGSYSGPMTADLDDIGKLMELQAAVRLKKRPDLTSRHLRPASRGARCEGMAGLGRG